MKLSEAELLPGVCIDIKDPTYLGRVKAEVPTVFNSQEMSKEGLPWIYPLNLNGYQSFSALREGSKIWVLKDKDNTEFWYWPMFELNEDVREIISSDESDYIESEVVFARNMGTSSVYLYFNPTEGIMLKCGDNSLINITPNNEIFVKAGDGRVTIKNDHVYIGDGEEGEPAVLGDKLKNLLQEMSSIFGGMSAKCANPYNLPALAPDFLQLQSKISTALPQLLCTNTNVD